MGQQIAVSFEDEWIKVVYGSVRKDALVVHKTLTLMDTDFDQWLASEKAREFIVICQFKAFFSDIATLPPAKGKYLGKMVEGEIRKKFPEARDFSYFFTLLGTKETGLRPLKEVFYFAVDNVVLHGIVERFERFNKRITLLCPDVLALSQLVRTSGQAGSKTSLCVNLTEGSKTLFLLKNGELRFIRVIPSMGREIHQMDIDNINMTISFCRQALRLDPQQIVVVNAPETETESPPGTIVPAVPLVYPTIIGCAPESIAASICPISALFAAARIKASNLVPQDMRSTYRQRHLLATGTLLFLVGIVMGMGYLALSLGDFFYARERIRSVRGEIPGLNALIADYRTRSENLRELSSYVAAVNEMQSTPEIQKALTELKFLPIDGVTIEGLQIKTETDTLLLHLAGQVSFRGLAEMHANYQRLLSLIRTVPTMILTAQNLDLRDGKFNLDIRYRKAD
jgi:hypothetical protein